MSMQTSSRRTLALSGLVLALALMCAIALSGFLLANAQQPWIAERAAYLSHIRGQFARIADRRRTEAVPRQHSADWDKLLLPVMSTGAAGAQLQGRLSEAAAAAGARLIRARVEPQAHEGLHQRVAVSVAIEAKADSLRKFLFALEREAPLTFIDRLDIARLSETGQDGASKSSHDDPKLAVSLQVSNYMKAGIVKSEQ